MRLDARPPDSSLSRGVIDRSASGDDSDGSIKPFQVVKSIYTLILFDSGGYPDTNFNIVFVLYYYTKEGETNNPDDRLRALRISLEVQLLLCFHPYVCWLVGLFV